MFYEGKIESFDSTFQKHKVLYVDGDVEILRLKEERWEVIDEFTVQDEGDAPNLSTPRASSEMPKKKKAKAKDGSSKSSLMSNSKGNAPKTDSKEAKDDTVAKTDDDTTKVGANAKGAATPKTGKSKAAKPKTESKLNDETPQAEIKSENDTSKTMQKSKSFTLRTGSKLGANGSSKGRPDTSKIKQSEEDGKVELSELVKAEENELKSGKRRRRVIA